MDQYLLQNYWGDKANGMLVFEGFKFALEPIPSRAPCLLHERKDNISNESITKVFIDQIIQWFAGDKPSKILFKDR